jgi:molybdenum cofactor cytidylyltransferase
MTGIIILAAGSSSRMGTAKQNLNFKGRTLLQTVIETAMASKCQTVAVILGANAELIAPTIKNEPVHILINKNWSAGMGTSISYCLSELLNLQPELTSVLFMLTDQPLTETSFINQLIDNATAGKIIASAYNNTSGPPVLFDKAFFKELLAMQGNDGAKRVLQKHRESVLEIPFANGAFDVDTPEDYKRLSAL